MQSAWRWCCWGWGRRVAASEPLPPWQQERGRPTAPPGPAAASARGWWESSYLDDAQSVSCLGELHLMFVRLLVSDFLYQCIKHGSAKQVYYPSKTTVKSKHLKATSHKPALLWSEDASWSSKSATRAFYSYEGQNNWLHFTLSRLLCSSNSFFFFLLHAL